MSGGLHVTDKGLLAREARDALDKRLSALVFATRHIDKRLYCICIIYKKNSKEKG